MNPGHLCEVAGHRVSLGDKHEPVNAPTEDTSAGVNSYRTKGASLDFTPTEIAGETCAEAHGQGFFGKNETQHSRSCAIEYHRHRFRRRRRCWPQAALRRSLPVAAANKAVR